MFLRVHGATPKYELQMELVETADWKQTRNNYGIQLMGGVTQFLTGKNEGDTLMDDKVQANQTVCIKFGTITPIKRECHVAINPALLQFCQASFTPIYRQGDKQDISITLTTFKAMDLSQFEWFITLYIEE